MAIKNPFSSSKKSSAGANAGSMPDLKSIPDWRDHPAIMQHREQLSACRERLPQLAHALHVAEQQYQDAERALDDAETRVLAGRITEADAALTQLKSARDDAKRAYAVARVEHSECASEHSDLEQSAAETELRAKSETARAHFATFAALLDTFETTYSATVAAAETMRSYYGIVAQQYPEDWRDEAPAGARFAAALGMGSVAASLHIDQMRMPRDVGGAYLDTQYSLWLAAYNAYKADGEALCKPH